MWIEKLARLGCATKALVYFIVGGLALQLAVGTGGRTTGSSGALHTIAAQPFGQIILAVVALGLFGYALWRVLEAIVNPDSKSNEAKDIGRRLAYFGSGVAYLGLAIAAGNLALGNGGGGGRSADDWTATLMRQPFGRWLVAIAGIVVIGLGIYFLYRAYQHKSRRKLDMMQVRDENTEWAVQVGRIGVAARGFVFGLIGWFLLTAARQADPSEARGLDGILQTVAAQPFGKILLGIVALGLIAYSFHMLVQARYRRMAAAKEADRQAS